MTEPVFQIISKKRVHSHKAKAQTQGSYNSLLQSYLTHSYGYYSELFIKRICQKVQNEHQKLRKFQLRKILRETFQKYLMTDLEIIFFQYFANLHEWNFLHPVIQQSISQSEDNNELNQINSFRLFLHLVCFFVKSYVSSKQQLLALIDFHNQNLPLFSDIYHLWIANNSEKLFQISPRELNQVYTEYSRSCGQKTQKKDYNKMVDKILDLSTTYSIIPSKQKEPKSKKSPSRTSKQLIPMPQKRNSLRYFDSNMWQQNNSLRLDSDLRTNKKESIIIGGSSILNQANERNAPKMQEKKSQVSGPKRISLNKKNKVEKDEVNNVTKSFFRGKDLNMSVQDIKKNENNLKDIIPNSFLDLNIHSSRIQSLPLPYRNNSNIFGPSTLF